MSTFTTLHTVLSLVGIASGVLVLLRPSAATKASSLNTLFLATTILANATGLLFMLAVPGFRLGHTLGVISLAVLLPTLLALYRHRLMGTWRWVFVTGAATALYLNAFIAVKQAFAKLAFLHELPTTTLVSPLMLAHLLVLAICVWLAILALARLKPDGSTLRRPRPPRLRIADRWG